MKKLLSQICFVLVLATTAPAITVNCTTGVEPGCAPNGTFSVTNASGGAVASGTLNGATNAGGGKVWTLLFSAFGPGEEFQINDAELVTNADPTLAFSLPVQNFTNGVLNFTIILNTPYIGGPYNQGLSTIQVLATAYGNTNVVVATLAPFANIHNPDFDGTLFGGLGAGCSLAPGNTDCTSGAFSGPINTAASGILQTTIKFSLSGGDSVLINGTAELTNTAIPEPATLGLSAFALLGLAFWRRRR